MPIYLMSGKLASGKTTISKALSRYLGIKRYVVSDYLKFCAKLCYGENYNRDTLQKIGDLKREEGYDKFCTDFLEFINCKHEKSFIVDGIRTIEFLKMLKEKLVDKEVIHIFVDIDEKTRYERLLARNPLDQSFTNHYTETSSSELMKLADIVINSNENIETILKQIVMETRDKK